VSSDKVVEAFLSKGYTLSSLEEFRSRGAKESSLDHVVAGGRSRLFGSLGTSLVGTDGFSLLFMLPPVKVRFFNKSKVATSVFVLVSKMGISCNHRVFCLDRWHPHYNGDDLMCMSSYGDALERYLPGQHYDLFAVTLLSAMKDINIDSIATTHVDIAYRCSRCGTLTFSPFRSMVTKKVYCDSCSSNYYGTKPLAERRA